MFFGIGNIDTAISISTLNIDLCEIKSNENKIFQFRSSSGLCISHIPFSYLLFSEIKKDTCPFLIRLNLQTMLYLTYKGNCQVSHCSGLPSLDELWVKFGFWL